MNASKRYTYTIGLEWCGEKRGILSAVDKEKIEVATPPEFKGPKGIWSPEDLFVAAANACFLTTLLSFAERLQFQLLNYDSQAEGVLEFAEGKLRFTTITLHPRLRIRRQDREKLQEALLKAEKNCLISASMLTEVVVVPTIEEADSAESEMGALAS